MSILRRRLAALAGLRKTAVPTASSTSFTYNGSAQGPTFTYDSKGCTLSGDTTGINAGSYSTTFTLKKGFIWADKTKEPKVINWSIAKAEGSVSLSSYSGTISGIGSTTSFTITRNGDGAISVSSSNTGIATVYLNGTTAIVTCVSGGSATIYVSVAAGTNYNATSTSYAATCETKLYLYNSGNECSGTTGGYVYNGGTFSSYQYSNISLTKYSTNMVFKLKGNYSSRATGCLMTNNLIPTTNYSSLKCDITVSRTPGTECKFGLCTIKKIGSLSLSELQSVENSHFVRTAYITSSGVYTLNISSYTSSGYFCFAGWSNNEYDNNDIVITINKIWLE